MSQDIDVLKAYFNKLGLEPEVADLYLALHAYGPQTMSELARHSGVERTRIYRLVDVLRDTGLVEVEVHYRRNILKAAPVSNLQILLSKKEEELRALQADFSKIEGTISQHAHRTPTTQVQFYKGPEGLKQMFWNETKSKTENLAILFENMQGQTKAAFFERWVREFNSNDIKNRSLVGDHFLETQKSWYKRKDSERIEKFKARYVPTEIFQINHSTVIYNNVVAYYNWHEGRVFGIEVYNQQIADAQRAFFEMLWAQSRPIDRAISQQLAD